MRLTKQTNYAFRILMYCAVKDGELSRVAEIAKAYGVSEPFLFKILQPLAEGGVIETVRGRNGGIRLARKASDITLLDVVRLTEDSFSMAECFEREDSDCPLVETCKLSAALREALNAFFGVLASHSIDDLARPNDGIGFLLGLERHKEALAPA